MSADMAAATKKGGHVILSGILNEQADEVVAVYCGLGYNLKSRDEIVEWTTLTFVKKA